MVDSAHERGMKEAVETLRKQAESLSPPGGSTKEQSYPTAMALDMARSMKRVATKQADLDLARRAKQLEKAARSALKKRQSVLSTSEASNEPPSAERKSANKGTGDSVSEDDQFAPPERGRKPRYKVMVDDNFHYQHDDDRWEKGIYKSLAQAISACCELVNKSLEEMYRTGMSAQGLYDLYVRFGDDPFIVVLDGTDERAEFSAWNYAKERSRVICQQRSPVPQRATKESASEPRKILGLSQDGGALPGTRTAPGSMFQEQTLDHDTSVVKSTMTPLAAKLKRGLGHVGTIIFFYFFVSAVIIGFLKLFGIVENPGPHAGDPCGAGHRWTWVGEYGPQPDLSCESE